MTRIVQLQHGSERRVALVDEPRLRILDRAESIYALAKEAAETGLPLTNLIANRASGAELEYNEIYAGRSPWRLLVPIDHPEPSRCLVSGTGLTHMGSAASRNAMHGRSEADLTDSMRMFRAGLEAGRPQGGCIGTAPEWFYKGSGTALCAHNEALVIPPHAEDGGEEAEIAGVYFIDGERRPRRIGMTAGNEFSDHVLEKRNYLNLAASKLRTCAVGPELVIDPGFDLVSGLVAIERDGRAVWQKDIATGEAEMCHSVANIEHHHFKFDAHRRPGDVHVHFFGAHTLSFSDGVRLEDGDVVMIQFVGFGRALRNQIRTTAPIREPVVVEPLL